MTEKSLLTMTAPLRDDFDIPYHDIGAPDREPRVALTGGLHGDEINSVYILARLSDFLRKVSAGDYPHLTLKERVIIVPAVNVLGLNIRTRTWPFDKNDLNRAFPGNTVGETTQRIAWQVLCLTRQAYYRIDLHNSNLDFEELPQVRVYEPSDAERAGSRLFGLSAVLERPVTPILTTTLIHGWRPWPGENYLIQAGQAGTLNLVHCQRVFSALVSFLVHTGVLHDPDPAEPEHDVHYFGRDQRYRLYADTAGMFVSDLPVGRWLRKGDLIGSIYDSFTGRVRKEVTSPAKGLLTGIRRQPLLYEGDLLVRINFT